MLNDYFDREQDARERPFRPIPSGRVSPRKRHSRWASDWRAAGVALGWMATAVAGDVRPGLVATLLALAVLLYDGVLKRTPLAPVVMGSCRTLNVLLGMSLSADPWSPAVLRGGWRRGAVHRGRHDLRPQRSPRQRPGQLAFGLVVLLAGLALVASMPRWATGSEWPAFQIRGNWYLFWLLLAGLIGSALPAGGARSAARSRCKSRCAMRSFR